MTRLTHVLDRLKLRRARRWIASERARLKTASPDEAAKIAERLAKVARAAGTAADAANDRLSAQHATAALLERAPTGSDWIYRPTALRMALTHPATLTATPGTAMGPDLTLHHDCPHAEISLRQTYTSSLEPPFALSLETGAFEGSYLSLAFAFPDVATIGLTKDMLIRLHLTHQSTQSKPLFTRLNLRHGPNTEQITREMPTNKTHVDFDLLYTELEPDKVTNIWADVILDTPAHARLTITDTLLSRRRRASL